VLESLSHLNPVSFHSSHCSLVRSTVHRLRIWPDIASPIERLSTKLLNITTGQFGYADFALRFQCSKQLYGRIEPAPYASQTVPNKAMPCLSAIRLASSCGADVSIVNVLEKFDFTRSSLPCDPNINAPLGGQKSPCRCLCAIVGAWSPNRRVCGRLSAQAFSATSLG